MHAVQAITCPFSHLREREGARTPHVVRAQKRLLPRGVPTLDVGPTAPRGPTRYKAPRRKRSPTRPAPGAHADDVAPGTRGASRCAGNRWGGPRGVSSSWPSPPPTYLLPEIYFINCEVIPRGQFSHSNSSPVKQPLNIFFKKKTLFINY